MEIPIIAVESPTFPWGIRQVYDYYSSLDHRTWKTLFDTRMAELSGVACDGFTVGIKSLRLNPDRLPRLPQLSARLQTLCSWTIRPVCGFLPRQVFFELLSQRSFPSTTGLRAIENLVYTPEPDIFHDIFGHIPMYTNVHYREYVQQLGLLATLAKTERELELISKVYWFTAEFGLLRTPNGLRVYGSGLLSSAADCDLAMSSECDVHQFTLSQVETRQVQYDQLQRVLFAIDSFDELSQIVSNLRARLS